MTELFFLHTSHFEGLSSVSERSEVIFFLASMTVLWQLKVRKVGHFSSVHVTKATMIPWKALENMFVSSVRKIVCITLCRYSLNIYSYGIKAYSKQRPVNLLKYSNGDKATIPDSSFMCAYIILHSLR